MVRSRSDTAMDPIRTEERSGRVMELLVNILFITDSRTTLHFIIVKVNES